jgi:hypothetical protein
MPRAKAGSRPGGSNWWAKLSPEEQEARREAARQRSKAQWDSRKGTGSPAAATSPPEPSRAAPRGGSGDVVALGTVFWGVASLPIGIVSPSGGFVMRMQMPRAGRDIDTLLKGTAFYEALTSGGKAAKGVAGYHLLAPPLLAIAGDVVGRMYERDPRNPQVANMLGWIETMLRQVLAEQGMALPRVQQARPAPAGAATHVAPEPAHPAAAEVMTEQFLSTPVGENGDAPVDVAAKAAQSSRFDAVE